VAVAIAGWWSPSNQPGSWLLRAAPGQNGRFAPSGGGLGAPLGPDPVRPPPWAYDGVPGEGSIPVPLPPPDCPRLRILRVNSRAIKPCNSSDFSFELRTQDRQSRPIVLRKARFSPKLCTPSIRYGSRNSNFRSYLQTSAQRGLAASLGQRVSLISNSPYRGLSPPASASISASSMCRNCRSAIPAARSIWAGNTKTTHGK
jgi:hypothetical protein